MCAAGPGTGTTFSALRYTLLKHHAQHVLMLDEHLILLTESYNIPDNKKSKEVTGVAASNKA